MVAHGVYEAGFENLRRHLRARRRPARRRTAQAAADRVAATVASRRRPPLRRPRGAAARRWRGAHTAAPAVRIRQRAISINYLDVYLRKGWIPALMPLPGVPGMEAIGHGSSTSVPASTDYCPATVSPISATRRAPIATSARCRPSGSFACPRRSTTTLAAATLLKGITADFLLRDLGHVGAGTRLLVHAASGGVGLLVCSWARRLGADRDRHGLERRQGAGRARVRLCLPDRDPRAPVRRGGAGAVRRRRRRRRRHRRRRARPELRRTGAARPLDQPRPGERRAAADRGRRAGVQVDHLLAPGGVRLRREATPSLAERARSRLGRR